MKNITDEMNEEIFQILENIDKQNKVKHEIKFHLDQYQEIIELD